jgi:GntR family transcriptional regulator, transcriptional repressor for pyruvate dehydrogenase complex
MDSVARLALAVELGLISPGDKLPNEVELAEAFGVAPITMRRALSELCARGVLVRRRGRAGGTFVASEPPNQHYFDEHRARLAGVGQEMRALLDYRLVLETGAVHVATATATDRDIEVLRDLVESMDTVEDWPAFRRLDPRLHLTIASIAGPQRLVDELADVLGRLRPLYFPHPLAFLRDVNRQHRAIVESIARRDPAGAITALSEQLTALQHELLVDSPKPRLTK